MKRIVFTNTIVFLEEIAALDRWRNVELRYESAREVAAAALRQQFYVVKLRHKDDHADLVASALPIRAAVQIGSIEYERLILSAPEAACILSAAGNSFNMIVLSRRTTPKKS